MKQPACVVLALAVAFNSVLLAWGASSFSVGNVRFGDDKIFDNDYENVNSPIYNILSSVSVKNGKCTRHVAATGNGVGDIFDLPCSANGVVTTTTDKILIHGNPEKDSFALFSNEPSTLVVFKDGKCIKKKYQTVTRKTFGVASDLSDEECSKICQKINFIEVQEAKYLELLDKHNDKFSQTIDNLVNLGKNAFKSATHETATKVEESTSQNIKPTDKKQDTNTISATGTATDPQKKPVVYPSLVSQFSQNSNYAQDNLKPLKVSHQETNKGLTVTEKGTSSNNNNPAPVAAPVVAPTNSQPAKYLDTSPKSANDGRTSDPSPNNAVVTELATDPSSSNSQSHQSHLSSKYSQIKTKMAELLHKPSQATGWDFSTLEKYLQSPHSA